MIFGSKAVRESIKAVKIIAAENSDILFADHVARQAIAILKTNKKKTEASIKEDGLSYNALAYLVMSNFIFNELSSGKHHIYRGTLNLMGQSMRQFWSKVGSGLIEEQVATPDQVAEDTAALNEAINSVG